MKNQSTFKKSVLSIVILSVATASFISWDKYQPRHETKTMVEFYQNRDLDKNEVLLHSLASNEPDTLARIAEDNLSTEADFIAASIIENGYSPEADEGYDVDSNNDQLENWQVLQHPTSTLSQSNDQPVITNTLLFGFDSSEVSPNDYISLNKTAHLMQSDSGNQGAVWQVVGYADRSGNYIYNSKLARKRAQAVAEYLVDKGVNENQLAIISLGTSNPPNDERSIENNRNERRVEIHAYQAEITALLEQHNKQLQQSRQSVVKRIKATTKETLSNETSLVETAKPETLIPTVKFEKQTIHSLTTAMEL